MELTELFDIRVINEDECPVCHKIHEDEEPRHPYCRDVIRYIHEAAKVVGFDAPEDDLMRLIIQVQAVGTVNPSDVKRELERLWA